MKKKGDFSISFGVIFSIIVIVAVLAVGFYMIKYFLSLQQCTQQGLYGRDLQKKVDGAWNSDITEDNYLGIVPSGTEKVCFGSLDDGRNMPEYTQLRKIGSEFNLFFYPTQKGCDINAVKLEHVRFQGFKCVDVKSGKAKVGIIKGSFDSLVLLCNPDSSNCKLGLTNTNSTGISLPTNGTNSTTTRLLDVSQQWCETADRDNLCNGLAVASGINEYKAECCSRYGKCCSI